MNCPTCGSETHVLATRAGPNNTVRRQRQCEAFKTHRFSTYEIVAQVYCSAKQRAKVHQKTIDRRQALRDRDIDIARDLHLGWRLLAEKYQLTKTAVYLAAKRGRNASLS